MRWVSSFYLKDFGTGAYQIGSGKSWDTVTLVPGDTTWNEENDNQWSDDVLNSSDASYVESCRNAYRGDPGFNPSMDHDGDGIVAMPIGIIFIDCMKNSMKMSSMI